MSLADNLIRYVCVRPPIMCAQEEEGNIFCVNDFSQPDEKKTPLFQAFFILKRANLRQRLGFMVAYTYTYHSTRKSVRTAIDCSRLLGWKGFVKYGEIC